MTWHYVVASYVAYVASYVASCRGFHVIASYDAASLFHTALARGRAAEAVCGSVARRQPVEQAAAAGGHNSGPALLVPHHGWEVQVDSRLTLD